MCFFFFFQAEDGIRDVAVTGVQTCALPISAGAPGGIGTRLGVAVLPALAQRLLEVGPERLAILEPRAEAEQPRRDAVALPAAAALDQARDAAERARIDDHAGRRLDLPRRLRIGHVE